MVAYQHGISVFASDSACPEFDLLSDEMLALCHVHWMPQKPAAISRVPQHDTPRFYAAH